MPYVASAEKNKNLTLLNGTVVAAWLSSTLPLFCGGNCLESRAVVPVKFWGVSKLQALNLVAL